MTGKDDMTAPDPNKVDAMKLSLMLTDLRLPTISQLWQSFAKRADKEGWTAARFLAALTEHELAERDRRRIERHLREARLLSGKTLDSFDFNVVPMISKAQVNALAAGDACGAGLPVSVSVKPLVEQRAVLGALARLDCGPARAALKRIVLSKGLPASQLPVAPKAGVPDVALRAGLRDASAPVRRAAAIALGTLGAGAAGSALIAELARDPSRKVIEALAAIGDDEAIVHLGRCAERDPALAGIVSDVLRDMESGRAVRLAARLEAGLGVSGEGGG